jgi:isoquinoline 1-oxidoreductase subunit alpha
MCFHETSYETRPPCGDILNVSRLKAVMSLTLLVNGTERKVDVPPEEKLLYVLREHLNLTGTKYGCGEGQCGACTVLLDGDPVRSCSIPVSYAGGKKITTIEGLEENGELHPVQQAFLDEEALQCGYCTSGMILAAAALLREHPSPTNQQIIARMDGNVCRCGTYPRIVEAIRRAANANKRS